MTAQRALWTFLTVTLAGPFLAALLAAAYTPAAIWANAAPFTAGDHAAFDVRNLPDAGGIVQLMARSALTTFVWAPIAAGIAALAMVALLFARGELGWSFAGIAGVIGFFLGYLAAPFEAGDMLPLFALAAGLIAAVLCVFLKGAGVLPAE